MVGPVEDVALFRRTRARIGVVRVVDGDQGVAGAVYEQPRYGNLAGVVDDRADPPQIVDVRLGEHAARFPEHQPATGREIAERAVTNADFAHTLGTALHRPTVLPTPLLPLKLRFGGELVESLLLFSQRVTPGQLEATDYQFSCPSLDAALSVVLQARGSG